MRMKTDGLPIPVCCFPMTIQTLWTLSVSPLGGAIAIQQWFTSIYCFCLIALGESLVTCSRPTPAAGRCGESSRCVNRVTNLSLIGWTVHIKSVNRVQRLHFSSLRLYFSSKKEHIEQHFQKVYMEIWESGNLFNWCILCHQNCETWTRYPCYKYNGANIWNVLT